MLPGAARFAEQIPSDDFCRPHLEPVGWRGWHFSRAPNGARGADVPHEPQMGLLPELRRTRQLMQVDQPLSSDVHTHGASSCPAG
jgi:hypothetical protein